MSKSIETLVPDIQELFDGHVLKPEGLDVFSRELSAMFANRFGRYGQERVSKLYLSNVGKPLRQLWYELRGYVGEPLPPEAKLKFLYGDVLEALVLLLAKEAGHTVTDEQKEVEVDGVRGRIDGFIDGVLVDVKSCSSRSYDKFKSNRVLEDDPFGYVAQLSGYVLGFQHEAAGWVAIDKERGNLCYTPLPYEHIKQYDVRERIKIVREALSKDEPPACCCEPVPEGMGGNMKLPARGSYCAYKKLCYPELRTFLYSSGPTYLTHVEKLPKVFEVT